MSNMLNGYTTHGHAIEGVPQTPGFTPASRARCGGYGLCPNCSNEVGVARARYNSEFKSPEPRQSIQVYLLKSETDEPDLHLSFRTAMQMIRMGIIVHCADEQQVVREGNTTVTVYVHRKI